jgi:adenosylcobinamide amidohydrolase
VIPAIVPAIPAPVLIAHPGWLLASFGAPVRACGWAVLGGGLTVVRHVAWLEVRNSDLGVHVDPRRLLVDRFAAEGLEPGVGLLTSRSVAAYERADVTRDGVGASCIATVGLSNALRAGDPPAGAYRAGTINILVHVDAPLTDEGIIEANAIATEAKTAVVLEAGLRSRETARRATGTGTDCTVVTCTYPSLHAEATPYAGKHTAAGSVVGAAVEQAVGRGVRRWLEDAGLPVVEVGA